MKIVKNKNGCTSVEVLLNQTIIYDPGSDSYIIETDTPDGQIHRSTIPSHILDELHNRAWEGGTMKKSKSKFCSYCGDLIPEGKEFIEFKGSHFHDDKVTCIANLKVTVENLRRKLIEINSITNNIP